jgi:cytochrome P450
VDVGRPDNKHLAFGLGSHFCLGAPLARLEGRLVFEAMLRRTPDIRLDGPPPRYRPNFNLRGLESLHVAV